MKYDWRNSPPSAAELKPILADFAASDRQALAAFARIERARADLLQSFPAAALTIAREVGPPKRRLEALRRISAGVPLGVIADALEIPPWLRRVPAQALHHPLPCFGSRRDDADLGEAIAAVMPKSLAPGANWVNAVFAARDACDIAFATWVARKPLFALADTPVATAQTLGAFAWFSHHQPQLIQRMRVRLWDSEISVRNAASSAFNWLNGVVGLCCDVHVHAGMAAFAKRPVGALVFVPLQTPHELEAEATRMSNCLAGYVNRLASGQCFIFSIRENDVPVADMEIGFNLGTAYIRQLAGPRNRPVSLSVRAAAEFWLLETRDQLARYHHSPPATISEARWEAIFAVYLDRARPPARFVKPSLRVLSEDLQTLHMLSEGLH